MTIESHMWVYIQGGLAIWKLRHCRGPGVSRGPHEMPLEPFS
ncbi:unnamed protein product [Staurois parvus]|uniref:Uncharacterized protein n=1 Tax=Staurois parvus TaxID=386267 RepID=A0ABN9FWN6_9NEOB|nr:unnamed protein product [Staurois parvus]